MAGTPAPKTGTPLATEQGTSYTAPFIVLTSLFFLWGYITCMNDILIPYLKGVFSLSYAQAALVQFSFFIGYFIGAFLYFLISIRYDDPINKIGYKNGLILGLLIAALGCALFYPAAEYVSYAFFLGALLVLAFGLSILQIAANPYVTLLGSPETASSRLNLSQAFNSLGTTVAPLIGGDLVFNYLFDEGSGGPDAVKIPYLINAALFVLAAVYIGFARLPRFTGGDEILEKLTALKFSHLRLGMVAIVCYVGAEVAIGSYLVNYIGLDEIMGWPEERAKTYLAFYWGGAMIGRFLGALSLGKMENGIRKAVLMALLSLVVFFMVYAFVYLESGISFGSIAPYLIFLGLNYIGFLLGRGLPGVTTGVFAIINVVLLSLGIFASGGMAFWALLAIGLFNSIMWSNIFSLAIKDLGAYTAQGSSLLIMMVVGGALVPLLHGAVADWIGLQSSFFVPIVCYLYIMYYGFSGHKVKPIDVPLSNPK
jgi:FHS family L-fucose permease-like MFS transporter